MRGDGQRNSALHAQGFASRGLLAQPANQQIIAQLPQATRGVGLSPSLPGRAWS